MVTEERIRAVLATSHEPIVVLDSERRIVAASETAATLQFLAKPYERATIARMVRQILDAPGGSATTP